MGEGPFEGDEVASRGRARQRARCDELRSSFPFAPPDAAPARRQGEVQASESEAARGDGHRATWQSHRQAFVHEFQR